MSLLSAWAVLMLVTCPCCQALHLQGDGAQPVTARIHHGSVYPHRLQQRWEARIRGNAYQRQVANVLPTHLAPPTPLSPEAAVQYISRWDAHVHLELHARIPGMEASQHQQGLLSSAFGKSRWPSIGSSMSDPLRSNTVHMRGLQQTPSEDNAELTSTDECKHIGSDGTTYVDKCRGRTTVTTDGATPLEVPSDGGKTHGTQGGCKAGTTCAIVVPAVLSVVAALVGGIFGVWAACVRKKHPQQNTNNATGGGSSGSGGVGSSTPAAPVTGGLKPSQTLGPTTAAGPTGKTANAMPGKPMHMV